MRPRLSRWAAPAAATMIGIMTAGVVRADAPDVVATIKPVHSLVAGVTEGVTTPHLLLKGGASPHTYAMRPSDARATEGADAIFWVGPEIETFFKRTVEALGRKARVVALVDDASLALLEAREGGTWEAHDDHAHGHDDHGHDDHGHDDHAKHDDHDDHAHEKDDDHAHEKHDDHAHEKHADHDDHDRHRFDGHVWLDPDNARKIVDSAVAVLSDIDPGNAGRYAANGDRMRARIDAMDKDITAMLSAVKSKPYIVFHDAYQYFERHYGLNAAGSITTSPENRPGAKRLYEIRKKIADLGAVCVFSEPQFEPALVKTLIDGTPARSGELDPIGAAIPEGPDAYFTIMTNLAESLRTCLQPAT